MRSPRTARDDRRLALGHLQALAGLQQVLRQPRPDPAPHAPEPGAGGQAGPRGQARELLLPPQLNWTGNNFPYTFFGLEPGTTKDDLRRCLERWNQGDNGILDLSKAYRLKPGTGWLVPPDVLHAPGSLVTYEPQWGSDVFGMYQSMVEGRRVPWELLVKDVPEEYHQDLDYLVEQLDWEKNVDPEFKKHNYLEPIVRRAAPPRAMSTSGSSTAGSTASSSSAPAS